MPTYEYQCKSCGHQMEEFQPITEPPLTHCPNCNTENLARVMGTGVGLIFKGTGFYQTDYKKGNSVTSSTPIKGEKKETKKEERKETRKEEKGDARPKEKKKSESEPKKSSTE